MKFMKKLMAVLIGIVAAVPFIAKAEESANFYTYKKGNIVNFYGTKADQDSKSGRALETIIFEDKGANDKFVETWLIGSGASVTMSSNYMTKEFKQSNAFVEYTSADIIKDYLPDADATEYNYLYAPDDAEKGFRLPTIADMVDVFGAVKTEGVDEYTFPNLTADIIEDREGNKQSLLDEFKRLFGPSIGFLEMYENGILLGDKVTTSPEKIWIIKLEIDADKQITGAKIVTEELTSANGKYYAVAPVAFMNKSADCHEDKKPYCYICNGEYKFVTEGTQGEGCKVVSGIDKAEDCAKDVCYKCPTAKENEFEFKKGKVGVAEFATCEVVKDTDCNPKTGKKSYILEFAIVAALCTISLLVVKRKELFKTM